MLVAARPAAACGPSPAAWWSLVSFVPADGGTDHPIDSPIVMRVRPFTTVFPERSAQELVQGVRLRMVAQPSGNEVAGDVVGFGGVRAPALVWRPRAPLTPRTTHRLSVMISNSSPRPADAKGETTATFTFTTGLDRIAPLRAPGALVVNLETWDAPVYKECPCGSCAPSGTRRGLRARVTVPPAAGGFSDESYDVRVALAADAPYDMARDAGNVMAMAWDKLSAGNPGELLLPIDARVGFLVPCFSAEIRDAADAVVRPEPVCLRGVDVTATARALDRGAPPTPDRATPATIGGDPPDAERSGCAYGGHRASAFGGLLSISLAAVLRRRRGQR